MAEQAGMIQGDISLLERGYKHVWAETLVRLAQALHVSADYLLGLTDDPTPARQRTQPHTPAPVG